jgi:hypothetical protein
MRHLISATLVCALAPCGASTATAVAGAAPVRCGPVGAHTLAASPQARIYSSRGSVDGCGIGHRYRLGSATICNGSGRVGPAAVSGDLAAYAIMVCGVDTGSADVIVMRISTGRRLSTHAASSISVGPESFESVGSIVVNPAGQVAWIVSASSIATHRRAVQVLAADRRGTRVLDSSGAIVPGSLRLNGSTLAWKRGTAVHAAKLG